MMHYITLTDYHMSCLQNVLTWLATGICGFDQRKATEIALGTVRLWLESNHSSVNHVIFCAYEMQTMKYITIRSPLSTSLFQRTIQLIIMWKTTEVMIVFWMWKMSKYWWIRSKFIRMPDLSKLWISRRKLEKISVKVDFS